MMKRTTSAFLLFLFLWVGFSACTGKKNTDNKSTSSEENRDIYVTLKTSVGDIKIRLYNETPLHRENFLKLTRDDFYNGVLFHRVIRNFMIQTGDPDSRHAGKGELLGNGGPGYTLPAEIKPGLFHKRGAVAAARMGDMQNPEKASSGSQFYIVQGRKFTDEELDKAEKRIDVMMRNAVYYHFIQQLTKAYADSGKAPDQALIQQEAMLEATDSIARITPYHFTQEQRGIYKTLGGAPHLDGNYTVFGEVVEGMNIVDKIAAVPTDKNDRPLEDVRILKVTVSKK
jgi:cyclophilin family peptidyl-prolyl cis-trans isomerase